MYSFWYLCDFVICVSLGFVYCCGAGTPCVERRFPQAQCHFVNADLLARHSELVELVELVE